MSKNKNKNAFGYANQFSESKGLTKREYFAAMAMQGLCVNKITGNIKQGECVDIAEMSVLIADELLNQLENDTNI